MLRLDKFLRGLPLFSLTALFSSDCPCPPEPCCPIQERFEMTPGYNAPERIAVDDCWDIFTTAEFTYWIPTQENMELGFVHTRFLQPFDGNWVNSDFEYKPGFKVGLGVNLDRDHWDLRAGYTWFRGSHDTRKTLELGGLKEINPRFIIPATGVPSFYEAKQTWRLEMDIADLALARHYSVGTSLSFHPFLGLRTAWIRQRLKNAYLNASTSGTSYDNVAVREKTHSWALGPRLGLDLDWALGCGFRLYGVGAGDLLFTRYTSLKLDQEVTRENGSVDSAVSYAFRQNNLDYLRHHLDLELGFGWNTYFACDKWHIDLRTGYVFEAFFDQNMFRAYVNDVLFSKSICPNGNLFVHGLNVRARLDF